MSVIASPDQPFSGEVSFQSERASNASAVSQHSQKASSEGAVHLSLDIAAPPQPRSCAKKVRGKPKGQSEIGG